MKQTKTKITFKPSSLKFFKSFFDYSLKEKKAIVKKATEESNRAQKETIDKAELLAQYHQIFYDETGIEISIRIDRALRRIIDTTKGKI
jgi:hypothetical protein